MTTMLTALLISPRFMENKMTDGNWIYLSHFYNDQTPGYGGKKDFVALEDRCISKGDKCNQLKISMSNHVGTHIDLPFHFHAAGRKLQDYTPSEWFFTNVEMVEVDVKKNDLLKPHHFPKFSQETECLLIKTNFENYRHDEEYWKENPGLTAELGLFFKKNYPKLKIIGVNFISATPFQNKEEGKFAHLTFLGTEGGNPILIIEDMKLSPIKSTMKIKQLNIAPFLIESADGTPVTISALCK
jgi:arylformamidase